MTSQPSIPDIERELDAIHVRARQWFLESNIDSYLSLFNPGVSYRQVDGRVVGLASLSRSLRRQFQSLSAADWKFTRESLTMQNGNAVEVLLLSGWFATVAFGFIHRVWRLARRGQYTWIKQESGWQIAHVEIESETVQPVGFQFGSRVQFPPQTTGAA